MLSEALRLLRVYHDLSQTELAERLNLSKSYVSEIESGAKTPSLTLVEGYAREFDIPASAILFFAENLDEPAKTTSARRIVARKILTLLRFIEERTERKSAKKKRRLSP
jgi:transcriptional regulator with XRE-family HTH domain